jgi:hypothetical protein
MMDALKYGIHVNVAHQQHRLLLRRPRHCHRYHQTDGVVVPTQRYYMIFDLEVLVLYVKYHGHHLLHHVVTFLHHVVMIVAYIFGILLIEINLRQLLTMTMVNLN